METLKFCMKSDNVWVSWKADKCPDFERAALEGGPPAKKQRMKVRAPFLLQSTKVKLANTLVSFLDREG